LTLQQRTGEGDKVWLASFHMTGAAQHWYFMLERDIGAVPWTQFKLLCQQRFGPALGVNHLADLARLPFGGSVAAYQEAFLVKMAHAGVLTPAQQVNLFTGGLPDAIRIDVELQAPGDLQRAMALARAYESRASAVPASSAARLPRPQCRPQLQIEAASPPASMTQALAVQPSSTTAPPRALRRLSPAEMAERRRQGLCFN